MSFITHLVLPDIQAKCAPDGTMVPMQHLVAAGRLIMDVRPEVIVVIGDLWDMPSLSSYDKGKKSAEGRRYKLDIQAGKLALDVLLAPLKKWQERTKVSHRKLYNPRLVFMMGNHENRINRAQELDPYMADTISTKDLGLEERGFEVHEFLEVVKIDGVNYSHYFPNSNSPFPIGRAHLIMNKRYQSCTCGHIQILDYFVSPTLVRQKRIHCIIAGSFYMHDEDYRLGQGNQNWRGLIVKRNVNEGDYSPEFVSIDDLIKRYNRDE